MLSNNIKRFMNNRMTIYRRSRTKDDAGGVKTDWVKNSWNVACRIYKMPGSGQTIEIDGEDYSVTMELMCGMEVDIEEKDKIIDEITESVYMVVRIYPVYGMKTQSHTECHLSRIGTI